MIALLLALQDTVVEALPEDVASAAAQAAAATTHSSINYLDLLLKASLPVQVIMLLLLVGSLISWVIIFRKARIFSRANREADDFEGRFWSGAELTKLYAGTTDRKRMVTGLEAIFEAGFREFDRLRDSASSMAARSWKARSAPCAPPMRAKWISWNTTWSCWPTSVRPRPTSAWSAPCSGSW